ncbi:hypothetical protein B0T14DRAFT_418296, partial [Immersiella caudata]
MSFSELDASVVAGLGRVTEDPADAVESIFPCSHVQEVFLAAQAIHPDMYHISIVLEIKSRAEATVDLNCLLKAWGVVVERHTSLRTVFVDSKQRPGHYDQVILKPSAIPLEVFNETSSTIVTRRSVSFTTYQKTHRIAMHPGPTSTYLRLDLSHAIIDGESLYIVLRDLSHAFSGETFVTIPMRYQDFVSHQQHTSPAAAITYWTEYLAGGEASFFPIRSDVSHHGLRTTRITIPTIHASACSSLDATISNICQLAWALVLGTYTASDQVCFSYAISGRQAPLPGIHDTIGSFAEAMLCRIRLGADITVQEAVQQVKRDFARGLAHPPSLIANDEAAARKIPKLRGNTFMSCQRSWKGEIQTSEIEFDVVDAVNGSDYDIAINVQIGHEELEVAIDFWQSRMDQAAVKDIAQCFRKAVLSILKTPNARLGELDVAPDEHIAQLQSWVGEMPPREECRIQDRVHQQRLLRPDAPAIQGWDGNFTYQELDDEANKLANHLLELHVGPEVKVPMVFEKSKWAIVAQLAILKAGGAVVPLGVKEPMPRIETILRNIEATVILTDTQNAAKFGSTNLYVIAVNADFMSTLAESKVPPPCAATPDNCAFVIFTSGSTGVPKGVVLPHASLCTSLHHLARHFRVNTITRMVQFSAYTFDISIQDIYTTLQSGACLCIISEEDRIANLSATMRAYGVTCAGLTSTVAALVPPEEVPTLETLVLLGEAVKAAVVQRWIPRVTVFNAYGPTECSIQASINRLTPESEAVNIGYALAGTLWVVDANDFNRLVPTGALGELLIEGPLLARGYLHDKEKTDAAFVPDPAWVARHGFGGGSRRFYRTGDLVRQNRDGSITYIGRRDTQVKVRGQRLETGEVEHWAQKLLGNEVGLAAAGVVVPGDHPRHEAEQPVLAIAVEIARPESCGSALVPVLPADTALEMLQLTDDLRALFGRLRGSLVDVLPSYMIPQLYIPVRKLPTTHSGKLNRHVIWDTVQKSGLSAQYSLTSGEVTATPSTLTEQQLQGLWVQVLRVSTNSIGANDNFFLSGGDSI